MNRNRVMVCALLLLAAMALGAQNSAWEHYSYGEHVLTQATNGSTILVGTTTGLVIYDLNTHEKQFLNKANSPLPDNWVSAVGISPTGVIWVGTPAGLCRVIGNDWEFFNTANTILPSNRIGKIVVGADNTLWAVSMYNDVYDYLYKFDGIQWTVQYHGNTTIQGQHFADLALDAAGNPSLLYYRTSPSATGLAVWNGSTWISHDSAALGITTSRLTRMAQSGDVTWMTDWQWIYRWDGVNTTTFEPGIEPDLAPFYNSLGVDAQGNLLVGCSSQTAEPLLVFLLRFDGTEWQLLDPNSQLPGLGWVNSLMVDLTGDIWLGTGSGVAVYDGSGWSGFSCSNSPLPSNSINYLDVDDEDRVWLSIYDTQGQISALVKKDGTDWTVYDSDEYPQMEQPRRISADGNGGLWFSSRSSDVRDALVNFDGTNWTRYDHLNSVLPDGWVQCMKADSSNNLWVAYDEVQRYSTVWKFSGGTWNLQLSTQHQIRDIAFDHNGLPWLATPAGVLFYDGEHTLFDVSNSALSSNDVRCLTFDDENNLWVGLVNGLAKYSAAGQWQSWDANTGNYPYRTYTDLAIDAWGRIWAGTTANGLLCFDGTDWTSFNTQNSPLQTDQIQQIAFDTQNYLWINTGWQGVSRLHISYSGIEDAAQMTPAAALALSNYPNPFNPSTRISFNLPASSSVKVGVYNIKGQLVRNLGSSIRGSGAQSIDFDGKDDAGRGLASGVYYVRISAGAQISTRKILLMK